MSEVQQSASLKESFHIHLIRKDSQRTAAAHVPTNKLCKTLQQTCSPWDTKWQLHKWLFIWALEKPSRRNWEKNTCTYTLYTADCKRQFIFHYFYNYRKSKIKARFQWILWCWFISLFLCICCLFLIFTGFWKVTVLNTPAFWP